MRRTGQVHQAIELLEQALALDKETKNLRGEGIRLGNIGLAYEALGDIVRAAVL
ncbi:MAG: hypothetical protein HZY76_23500 [Anaerolineae bacterium]|nr:MAG: hypothetical protein HZY76_23500 [Anaerolineae bacterium]